MMNASFTMTNLNKEISGSTLRSQASALEFCIRFMQQIADGSGTEINRFHACSAGLRAILSCLDEYDNRVLATGIFYDSLICNIKELAEGISRYGENARPCAIEMAQDYAFLLVEDMALLVREKYLREGCDTQTSEERILIDYFETRGHWRFGDQTLVTEFYYIGLPIAVINSMVNSLS